MRIILSCEQIVKFHSHNALFMKHCVFPHLFTLMNVVKEKKHIISDFAWLPGLHRGNNVKMRHNLC